MTALAPYLTTPLATDLGRSPDQSAVPAFCTRPGRTEQIVRIAYKEWTWRLHLLSERTSWRRAWPNPENAWDSPDSWVGLVDIDGKPLTYGEHARNPQPLVIPWSDPWTTGETPLGMNADNGLLIANDDASSSGLSVLGLRPTPWWTAAQIAMRAKPTHDQWGNPLNGLARLFSPSAYRTGDMVFDGAGVWNEANARLVNGRGVGRYPKRMFLTTRTEILDGRIDHAIGIVDSRIQHGPTPKGGKPARAAGPRDRVEHPTRDPNPGAPSPAGDVPSRYPHGTTFAHTRSNEWVDSWLDRKGVRGEERATLRLIALTMGERTTYPDGTPAGRGFKTVETGTGPDAMVETDGPLPGLRQGSSIEGLYDAGSLVVLNPAA